MTERTCQGKRATDAVYLDAVGYFAGVLLARERMGEAMSFRVGQEVVSLRTHFNKAKLVGVVKGEVYRIRKIECYNEKTYLMFAEHPVIPWGAGGERGWDAEFFRPIVKTDISIFTAMLAPSPKQRVDADAA